MSSLKPGGLMVLGLSLMLSLFGCGEVKREETSLPPIEEEKEEESIQGLLDGMSPEIRGSISMLNYMAVLAQRINEDKGNQLFLEQAYNSLVNDIYPNAVDAKTQAQIGNLLDTINNYRMISVKRERLRSIYDQNKARALRQALKQIPPRLAGIKDAVELLMNDNSTGGFLKLSTKVLNMAMDSADSYNYSASLAEKQFLQEGWELDDKEAAQLHESTKEALNYMFGMVREYDLPGDLILSSEAVKDFVEWSDKPDSQLANKIAWFESHKSTYQGFGLYWLEMVKNYYDYGDYEKCLGAIEGYECVAGRIFRKDLEYANALPMVLVAARETLEEPQYIQLAEKYCPLILANIKDADWSLRYFAAQIYLDLYSIKGESRYLQMAYQATFDNVVVLVEEQKELNKAYLGKLSEEKAPKGASERVKKEVKAYNKQAEKERSLALPPVSEPLYLSCRLLFDLAQVMDLPKEERQVVDTILHENGGRLFLTQGLDKDFWFYPQGQEMEVALEEMPVTFEEKKLSLPAICLSDSSVVSVSVQREKEVDLLQDWTIKKVTRPDKAGCEEYKANLSSKEGEDYDFHEGDIVTVMVSSMGEEEKGFSFAFEAKKKFPLEVLGLAYERIASSAS